MIKDKGGYMKDIRMKIIAFFAPLTLFACLFGIFYMLFFYKRDLSQWTVGLPQAVSINVIFIIIVAVIIWKILTPLVKVLKRIENGEAVNMQERYNVRKLIMRLPLIIILMELIGFVLGTVIANLLINFIKDRPFDINFFISIILMNIAIALWTGLVTNSFTSKILIQPLAKLNITRNENQFKTEHFAKQMISSCLTAFFLLIVFSLIMGFGHYKEEVLRPEILKIKHAKGENFSTMEEKQWQSIQNICDEAALSDKELNDKSITYSNDFLLDFWIPATFLLFILGSMAFFIVYIPIQEHVYIIRELKKRMEGLIHGKGDLDDKIAIVHFDEVGELTQEINFFMDYFSQILHKIESATQSVTQSSEKLSDAAELAHSAIEDVSHSVDIVAKENKNQDQSIEKTKESITAMLSSIDKVIQDVATQSSFVEQSSAAMTEISASIESLFDMARKANAVSDQLQKTSTEGGKLIFDTVASFRDVSHASDEVNKIIVLISKIAAQTNLLAMNAAIEAAHAGDMGRGFAVVASEVRNLAINSSESIGTIKQLIKKMTDLIKNGVELAEQAGHAFENISADINKTSEIINSITNALEEQQSGAGEVLNSVNMLVKATEEIKELMNVQQGQSTQMNNAISILVDGSQNIRNAIENQNESSQHLAKMINELSGVASVNLATAQDLSTIVKHYQEND